MAGLPQSFFFTSPETPHSFSWKSLKHLPLVQLFLHLLPLKEIFFFASGGDGCAENVKRWL